MCCKISDRLLEIQVWWRKTLHSFLGQVHSMPLFMNRLTPAIVIGKMIDISLAKAAIFKRLGSFWKLLLHLWPSGGARLSVALFRVRLNPTPSVKHVAILHCWGGRDPAEVFSSNYAPQGPSLSPGGIKWGTLNKSLRIGLAVHKAPLQAVMLSRLTASGRCSSPPSIFLTCFDSCDVVSAASKMQYCGLNIFF